MRMRISLFAVLFFTLVTETAAAQTVAPPMTAQEAITAKFQCPSGAHDSGRGPSPGVIVRWCQVQRDSRLLYHGPVWRWYRSGKLEGKEYYVYGDAAGVWPSYYENGHMSSLGAFEKGEKRGLWKYWDKQGQLRTEVTYSDEGNLHTDYYPSGRKKAVGVFAQSGKIGKWTYWDENGNEKAHCDFGRGVFGVSDGGCRMIADELDPKGYSPPIPTGVKGNNGSLSVQVGPQVFKFTAPQGWVADVNAGRRDGLPLVLYPKGKKWKASGENMYLRIFFKKGRSFKQVIKDDEEGFENNVSGYHEQLIKNGNLPSGLGYLLNSITYQPLIDTDSPFSIVASNHIYEHAAYLDASDKVVVLIVVTADSNQGLQHSIPAFQSILQSAR
jgi:MORN repeat variant